MIEKQDDMTLERAMCGLLYGAHASWSFNTGKIMLADGAKCWAIWLGEIGTAEVENTFFAFAKGSQSVSRETPTAQGTRG